jgi:hypothetical protein
MKIVTVGLNIAKQTFQAHGVDCKGKWYWCQAAETRRIIFVLTCSRFQKKLSANIEVDWAAQNVDDFVAVKASKLNREQQPSRLKPQLVQDQSLGTYRIQ